MPWQKQRIYVWASVKRLIEHSHTHMKETGSVRIVLLIPHWGEIVGTRRNLDTKNNNVKVLMFWGDWFSVGGLVCVCDRGSGWREH